MSLYVKVVLTFFCVPFLYVFMLIVFVWWLLLVFLCVVRCILLSVFGGLA